MAVLFTIGQLRNNQISVNLFFLRHDVSKHCPPLSQHANHPQCILTHGTHFEGPLTTDMMVLLPKLLCPLLCESTHLSAPLQPSNSTLTAP